MYLVLLRSKKYAVGREEKTLKEAIVLSQKKKYV